MTELILDAASEKMKKTVEHLADELLNVRAGRATTNILNGIMVDYYGTATPIDQLSSVMVPDAKTILIQPWEKGMIGPIEKAILISNIGMTPSNNGEQIRLSVPALTEERRKNLVKQIREEAESARVSVRNARREAMEAIKKEQKDGLPEDTAKAAEIEIQKATDNFSKKLEELLEAKEQEIMKV